MHQQLAVHVSFLSLWCWLCHSQLAFTSWPGSLWFNSHSWASLPGETTSVFSHFKSPCQSGKLKVSSWVINLVQAMTCSISLSRHLMGATFFFFFSRGVVKRCFGMLEMHCKPTKLVPFVGISACLKCIASLHSLHVSQSWICDLWWRDWVVWVWLLSREDCRQN